MWWDRAKQFLEDTSGAAFVYVGMMLAALTGFAGLAVDVGYWYSTQRSAQSAADSAAVAAAFEIYWGGDEASATVVAKEQAALNGFDAPKTTITVNSPPSSGPNTGDAAAVEVIIERPTTGFFSSIFQQKLPVNIRTRSVASRVPATPACMVALAPSGIAIEANSGSTIDAAGCAIHINSTDPGAMTSNGTSFITADEINIASGGTASGTGITPAAQVAPALNDPLAYLQDPIHLGDSCSTIHVVSGIQTLNPAVYCDLKIETGATVTFSTGTYILKGGKFLVENGATIRTVPGAGVTFVAANGVDVELNSGSNADLEAAPITGEFPGILFYQLRDATNASKNLLLNSDSGSQFVGAIYYPMGQVVVNSASTIGGLAPFSSIVAHSIQVNSGSTITLNTNFTGSNVPDVPTLGAYRVSLFE